MQIYGRWIEHGRSNRRNVFFIIVSRSIRFLDHESSFQIENVPVLFNQYVVCRSQHASSFHFLPINLASTLSHDISLSFPRISRAQLTRLRLIVQAPREIFDRHQFWSGSNRIFLLVKSSSSMHYNFNEIHLWIYILILIEDNYFS